MIALKGKIKNGQVVLDQPADLPDDTMVIVTAGPTVTEDDTPMTPEEIARALAALDTIEPFDLSDAERAALEADRQARREWEKARFDEHAAKLRRIWE